MRLPAVPREPKRGAVTSAFRPFLWLLLVATLFVRAFVPQGYMAERSADSTFAVAICGADGHWTIAIDPDESAPNEQRADPPCAFAGLGTPALPPAPPMGMSAFTASAVAYFVPSIVFESLDTDVHLPPARGPPYPA